MPAGAVEDQDDLFVWSCPGLAGKGGQLRLEEGDAHAGRQMEEGATRGGMDEAHQVAPGVAMLYRGNGALPDRRPDAAAERFQADAMLIRCPQFHCGVGKGDGNLAQQRSYLFLKASCAAGSACTCCGRGNCWLCLRRCR